MLQSTKLIKKKRTKARSRRGREEREKEPYIIGVYDNNLILCEEIFQTRKERGELTYEIYGKYIHFKKKEVIIKDKRNDEEIAHDINQYLKLITLIQWRMIILNRRTLMLLRKLYYKAN